MAHRDEEFLKQLRATFRVEAAEHLQAIAAGLLELEKKPGRAPDGRIVETVFRAAHSLKGAARAADFPAIESLCQSLEEVFAAWKRRQAVPSAEALDALHRALDAIASLLAAKGPPAPGAAAGVTRLRESLRRLVAAAPAPARKRALKAERDRAAPPGAVVATPAPPAAPAATDGTVRIAVAKLEARLLEAEEMLVAKLTADQRAADLRALAGRFEAWRRAWAAIEPGARRLRSSRDAAASAAALPQMVDFLESSMDSFRAIEEDAVKLGRAAEHDRHVVGRLVDELLENSKRLLLLPLAALAAPLPKLVRDLCRDRGKEADLEVRGEGVEVDKRILEELKDPLTHLLRNSVDHGIEPPDERARRGKPPRGTITLAATQVNGNKVQLLVSDDGAGIDTGRVKAAAVRHGLISAEEAAGLGESAARELIFRSDVSTSQIITQVSGRGLGLAIVREKAEKLGGKVSVESTPGAGTTFRIVIPATQATFRGVVVEAGGRQLVVPTARVARVARARAEDVETVEGRECLSLDGRAVPLVRLADVLELPRRESAGPTPGGAPVVVLGAGDQSIAFAVDAVTDELEVLVRPLPRPLVRVRNVAAATVLGSGQVAPILNVADLLKSAPKVAAAPPLHLAAPSPAGAPQRTILLVEDSITSRMLLKGILESAGYRVRTAVDGMEAFTLLRTEPVDLLVSDVEMPRLNGFDLTARVRADGKLADLPVVLVTALETREDRERGVDVGANAYLVKSSFDQSNLLDTVRRLVRTGAPA